MEQLALATTEINTTELNVNEQNESLSFQDIFDKYDLNNTEKETIELKVFQGLGYRDIAVKLNRHMQHINRVLNTPKVKDCIAEMKQILFNEGIKELTEIAYSEAVRLLKDKDTPIKQRVDLIKHILPEGKRNIDLNVGQQEKQNW
jgi:IS30 family transposase